MRLLANGVRRGPIKYELREGQLLANGSIREWQALSNQYLANYLGMTGTVFGAQLKRNVEERSSPASGPLACDYQEPGVQLQGRNLVRITSVGVDRVGLPDCGLGLE